jgi:glycogen synthase
VRDVHPSDGLSEWPTRIALMPSAFAPLVGGVEELTRHLARGLARTGRAVEVWAPRPNAAVPAFEVMGGTSVRRFAMPLPPARIGPLVRFPFDGGRSFASLVGAVRAFRPDLIHVQCFSVNGAYATAMSTVCRVPLVVTLQGETLMDDHDIFDRSLALRTALRAAVRRASAVTGCSQFVLHDAEERFGLPPEKAQVVFNGVELAEVEPEPVSVPFARFVLGLGRVVRKKGFDLLLEAFCGVRQRFPDVGLVIAGDGPERSHLEEHARRLGLEAGVHLPGALDRRQVAWAMATADAFVMPSRVEPFGIVALEAWRAGCPLVVSSVGGAPEVVRDGVDGLVRDPLDTRALGAAIAGLLADGELRRTLAANGLARVKQFDWAVIVERYLEVYRRIRAA